MPEGDGTLFMYEVRLLLEQEPLIGKLLRAAAEGRPPIEEVDREVDRRLDGALQDGDLSYGMSSDIKRRYVGRVVREVLDDHGYDRARKSKPASGMCARGETYVRRAC